jgi:ubiquinone/menaquinone biosynthesis C-methylase UbiE
MIEKMENRVFDPANRHKLESPERYKILPPFNILKYLNLQKDDIMIDIGCGTGYFTLPASKIIGPGGRVIGLDISEEMLDEVRSKIENNGINIELMLSNELELPLRNSLGTFVLMSNVLHEAEDKGALLKEANRVLKPGGRLALIEWEKKPMDMGPPLDHRLLADEITFLVSTAGFSMSRIIPAGEYHIACTAVKKR